MLFAMTVALWQICQMIPSNYWQWHWPFHVAAHLLTATFHTDYDTDFFMLLAMTVVLWQICQMIPSNYWLWHWLFHVVGYDSGVVAICQIIFDTDFFMLLAITAELWQICQMIFDSDFFILLAMTIVLWQICPMVFDTDFFMLLAMTPTSSPTLSSLLLALCRHSTRSLPPLRWTAMSWSDSWVTLTPVTCSGSNRQVSWKD